jgi:hypothetical protein
MQIRDSYADTDTDDWALIVLLPVLGCALLWFAIQCQLESEFNAVGLIRRLVVTELAPATAASLESSLVHFTGYAQSESGITDPLTGMSTQKGLLLARKVQKYSSQERFVDVQQRAASKFNAASKVNDESKNLSNIASLTMVPSRTTAGNYVIPGYCLPALPASNLLPPTQDAVSSLHKKLGRPVQMVADSLYIGRNPGSPQNGDLKITYYEAPSQQISIVAKKDKNTFAPYAVEEQKLPIMYLHVGDVDATTILKPFVHDRKIDLQAMRLSCFMSLLAALILLEAPILKLYSNFPSIAKLFGEMITPFQIATSCVVTGVITASAWLRHEPLFALLVITVTWLAAVAVVSGFRLCTIAGQRLSLDPTVGLCVLAIAKIGLIKEGVELAAKSATVFAAYCGHYPITPN